MSSRSLGGIHTAANHLRTLLDEESRKITPNKSLADWRWYIGDIQDELQEVGAGRYVIDEVRIILTSAVDAAKALGIPADFKGIDKDIAAAWNEVRTTHGAWVKSHTKSRASPSCISCTTSLKPSTNNVQSEASGSSDQA